MSLLNDMLRDLVKQQKVLSAPAVYSHDILHETTLLKRSTFNWIPSAIVFVAVFSLVLAINYLFNNVQFSRHLPFLLAFQTAPDKEILPVAQSAVEAAAVSPIIEIKKSLPAAPISEDDVTDKATTNLVVDDEKQIQREIADLLLQANRALTEDKLTSPIDDNAYTYFQTIWSLSPNHPQAKIGFEMIAARYLEKAREQMNLGNYEQVEILSQRAKFVAPDYFRDHDFTSSEKGMMQNALVRASKVAEAEVAIASPAVKPQSETIKPFVVAQASSINVVPNAAWKDEQLSSQARELVKQGNVTEALKMLKTFVSSEEKPIQSTLALAEIYSQQANAEALEVLVKTATFLSPVDRARLRAQMLIAQGDSSAAIAELEAQLSAASNNEQYATLLASLYHKTGNYQRSVVSYQRLISSYGEKPAYWLGLALAFDGLAQRTNALQAYQHLAEFPQLQDQVREYINQRIAALRAE